MKVNAFILAALLTFCVHAIASAQTATATLAGTVTDQSQAVIPTVALTLVNADTAFERRATSASSGTFSFTFIPPGRYTLRAERDGFTPAEFTDLVLNVADHLNVLVVLQVGGVTDAVTVVADVPRFTESPTIGTVIDRHFLESLPLNGRTLQSLVLLTPGVMATPVAFAGFRPGQFSVNGQRESTNTLTVDGVSANVGTTASTTPVGAEGQYPAFDAVGTTIAAASVDAVQELRIQTSNFAPEFGRTPGAQVSVVTRAGTNVFHGSGFEYFRDDRFDANDYFAERAGLAKPEYSNSQFGGVVGGPIVRNQTIFFASYEGLRLRLPRVATRDVPSLGLRQRVSGSMRTLLDAFPQPTGREFTNGFAEYTAAYTNPADSDSTSLRVDHRLGGTASLFGRFTYAPSESLVRGTGAGFTTANLAQVTTTGVDFRAVTLGATLATSSSVVHDMRFNYTERNISLETVLDEIGGAVPFTYPAVAPSYLTGEDWLQFQATGTTAAMGVSAHSANRQQQFQFIETASIIRGSHEIKAGIDVRRLISDLGSPPITLFLRFANQTDILQGTADLARSAVRASSRSPKYLNVSLFVQDTWRASERLSLSYGVRWDHNPPPVASDGRGIPAVVNIDDFARTSVVLDQDGTWKKTYNNFAPRVGAAYQLRRSPQLGTVVRGGAGVFYDLVTTNAGYAYSSVFSPYSSAVQATRTPYPLQGPAAAEPVLSSAPPYYVQYFAPDLKLPYTVQWNATLEQALGDTQSVSISYIGNSGRRLYRTQTVTPNPTFRGLFITTNEDYSDYNGLQIQFQRRLSRGLQATASYAWAKAMDTNSGEQDTTGASDDYLVPAVQDYAPSDFDIRHAGSVALTYDVPARSANPVTNALVSGWSIDGIFRARSAAPVDIWSSAVNFAKVYRPNLVPGQSIYLEDPAAPGGRRLNRAAFTTPVNGVQGNLGRNTVRGFPASQLDMSVRRQIRLAGQTSVELRMDVFNVFNQAVLANPVFDLANARFGESTSTLATSLGNLNALYQIGGPRSIQLGLRVKF